MKHFFRWGGVAFLFAALLLCPSVQAQETTGTIHGTIKDQSGASVAGATIELSSPELIANRTMQTDIAGFYRFTLLPTGVYAVSVTMTGFKIGKRTTIKLDAGRDLPIDFELEVGTLAATVEVQATPIIVDTTQSKVAVNISQDLIQSLPKGRSFASLIELAPGARSEPLQAGYQLDGASDGENVYAFEGMDTTRVQTGGIGVNIPLDFVQEVNIKTSGFEAEYGGALGGVINLVAKRGSNAWHGAGIFYYRSNALTASDRPTLRLDPTFSLSAATRTSEPAQLFDPKEDKWRAIEPGFEIGGPIMSQRVWLYGSFIPNLSRTDRTVAIYNQTPLTLIGDRSFLQTDHTLYGIARSDWQVSNTVRANASWVYAYRRFQGSLPGADSIFGTPVQRNGDALTTGTLPTDPGRFRPDTGQVLPNSTYTFTGEWTPTPKLVITGRFGYWHTNIGDRGRPTGDRRVYSTAASATTAVMGAATPPIPSTIFGNSGTANMTSNLQTVFDVFNRHGLNVDGSYFARGWGSHVFKVGYAFNRLQNDVQRANNTSLVNISWGTQYGARLAGGLTACATISATNFASFGTTDGQPPAANNSNSWGCRGLYGFYTVQDGVNVQGDVASFNHSIYFQDAWGIGKGITLNLGLRMDQEKLPSFKSGPQPGGGNAISDPISFGFGDKLAPRLGIAWDVLGKGKLKAYASWGYFYDIMKYELPRGAFGGDYWHDCVFTLDTTNLASISPVPAAGHVCPSGGGNPGTFIEEINWRTVSNLSTDNRVAPDLKPMRQWEMVGGVEYSLTHNIGLDIRYARKRLNRTIEDVGVFDASVGENYYIANPGEGIVTNPLAIPGTPAFCASCPDAPLPTRNYDGLEFRVTKRWSGNWFGSFSYTYSRLFGNYSGLTSTDEVGRHSPNVNRFFDLPHMSFRANGQPDFGLLPTDRPHTLKGFGSYRLKWWGMETTFGLNQQIYSGTPIYTEVAMISSSTSTSSVEGRNTFVEITRAANGAWVRGASIENRRTEAFTNTDGVISHDFKLSKSNEALRATIELNVSNLFNESNTLGHTNRPVRTNIMSFGSDPVTGSPNWAAFFGGFDFIALANNPQLVPTVSATTLPLTLDSRYGLANRWQGPRALRLKLKVSF